ncbi:hypothetical protein EII31_06715 [Leucobacter sp. OH2974_COT-288]|uniref:Uncharacterized protein n=1 Tax=Canibacter oris TaxID=1365628 RepID=A0A840DNN8_9MICO|nr:hypothetical protein [Canibacter oris]MBB4071159.1 hypothetical protein [Canibacter oris]RRD35094.1 hypothetical protein EII31_06715 [Leucobacter sp. OH2974_COT-288]
MSNSGQVEPIFATEMLVPQVQRIGNRDIEVTYLGTNTFGESTWILWNAQEPTLIGMLRQADGKFTFEQRTSVGAMQHSDLTREKVQLMLGS